MTAPVIFTDLDDTLFQTVRKCPDGASDSLRQMSTLEDGSASGFATLRQQHFLDWLRQGAVIPVTARGKDVLARVDIEQAPAICSNGGCIVGHDARHDAEWHEQLEIWAREDVPVEGIYAALTATLASEDFRHWVVSENGLPLYIVIKSNYHDETALAGLADRLADHLPRGWRRHLNGNNLAFLPGWLNKRHAVLYMMTKIRAERPNVPIIGVGDSLSDAGFMDLCDFAMMPTTSQLWRATALGNSWIG